jgi:hypothetical protein
VCELLGLDVSEEVANGTTTDSLLAIALPVKKTSRLPEPPYLQEVGLMLAVDPPGLLDFQRKISKKARLRKPGTFSYIGQVMT